MQRTDVFISGRGKDRWVAAMEAEGMGERMPSTSMTPENGQAGNLGGTEMS